MTDAGQSLITQAIAGTGQIEFTSVKTSSYSYPSGTNIAGLTDLQDIVQSVEPSYAQVFNSTMLQISARFDNSGVDDEYLIQTIGVYAQAADGSPVLFAVLQATSPDQMPPSSNISPSAFIYNIQITVQRASQITVTVSPAGAASVQDLENLKAEIRRIIPVTLTAAGWSGSAAPYTQSASAAGITEADNPMLVSMLADGADLDTQKAYSKAFGIVASGTAVTGNGTVTFKAYKKPETDIVVGLKGV